MTLRRPTPLGALVALHAAELVVVGLAIALDAANPLYATMAGVAGLGPVRLWGGWMVLAGTALGLAFRRQRRTGVPSRALFVAANLAGAPFAFVATAYGVHFGGVNTATGMYLPSALACFYLASEGDSPWGRRPTTLEAPPDV